MKSVFGCLLCLVFTATQSYAVKGGPDFGSKVRTTGIYAGVLTPGALSPGANSIGLFSVTIPKTGIGTGTVILFTAGQTYTGTFQGIADPDSAKLTGEIDAGFPFTTVVPSGTDDNGNQKYTSITVLAKAAGKVDGRIRANSTYGSTASARIIGTSNVQFSIYVNQPFTQIGYDVIGFKQQDV